MYTKVPAVLVLPYIIGLGWVGDLTVVDKPVLVSTFGFGINARLTADNANEIANVFTAIAIVKAVVTAHCVPVVTNAVNAETAIFNPYLKHLEYTLSILLYPKRSSILSNGWCIFVLIIIKLTPSNSICSVANFINL